MMIKHETNATTNTALPEDVLVPVHREWNGWRTAHARLSNLEDVHWFQPPGAPRVLLHAFVKGSDVVTGSLVDAFDDAQRGERLLVCVLKHDTIPTTYSMLASRADQVRVDRAG